MSFGLAQVSDKHTTSGLYSSTILHSFGSRPIAANPSHFHCKTTVGARTFPWVI
jgi:hypothetical protein